MTTFNTLMTSILMNTTSKIMTALGVGFLSYEGLDMLQIKMINLVQDKLNGLPSDALQLLMIGGLGDYLNWVASGVAFSLTIKTTKHLTAGLKIS